MRKLLFVLLILVIVVGAIGFYRGWFSFETTRDPDTGNSGVKFEVNQNKIRPDLEKVKQTVGGGKAQGGENSQGNPP
jgi:hypothetical protein